MRHSSYSGFISSNHVSFVQGQLERDDLGQHLMGVEDLLQKQSLLQQDIAIHGERVREIDEQSQEFLNPSEEGQFHVQHNLALYSSVFRSCSCVLTYCRLFYAVV